MAKTQFLWINSIFTSVHSKYDKPVLNLVPFTVQRLKELYNIEKRNKCAREPQLKILNFKIEKWIILLTYKCEWNMTLNKWKSTKNYPYGTSNLKNFTCRHEIYLQKESNLYQYITLRPFAASRTPWPFSKSKLNLKTDRVNLVAPASPIECLLYLPNVRRYSTNCDRKGWPARKFKCTTAARGLRAYFTSVSKNKQTGLKRLSVL